MELKRGSNWHRWDLHIHTPKSIVNQYGGDTNDVWEKFITSLERLPEDVKVIGITDYYFIDGYEKVMQYKFSGRLRNIEKIFPIVEFRVDTFGAASKADLKKVNLHVLFNVDESNYVNELKVIEQQFFMQIKLSKLGIHSTVPLTKENLTEYARDNSLQNGFSEIIPSTDEVLNLVENHTWKNKTFVFLGYKEWDCLDFGNQLHPFKTELFNRANAFFTGSPTPEQTKKQNQLSLFGDKPLVHSLDIHSFNELEEHNYKCFTWIKGDFTFGGLNQIKHEPKERIIIKSTNPYLDEIKTNVIDSIKISNSNQWFTDDTIELNRGLVAIIGEKGAGKTALLDMLAISSEEGIFEADIKTPSSFYFRVKKDSQLEDVKVDIKLEGIDEIKLIEVKKLNVKTETNKNAKLRYLSLKELENYSSNRTTLQDFIKEIINSNDTTIKDIQLKYNDLLKTISGLNDSINENTTKLEEQEVTKMALKSKEAELSAHNTNIPKNKSEFDEESEKQFKMLLGREAEITKDKFKFKQKKQELIAFISWIEEKVKSTKNEITNEIKLRAGEYDSISELVEQNISVDITINGIQNLQDENAKNDVILNEFESQLEVVEKKLGPLKQLNNNFAEEQSILKKWLEKKSELEREVDSFKKEIERMANYELLISSNKSARQEAFQNLLKLKLIQKAKYIELKRVVEQGVISFDVSIDFNMSQFESSEESIINHGSGNSQEVVRNLLGALYTSLVEKLEILDVDSPNIDENIAEITKTLFACDDLKAFIIKYFNKDDITKLMKKNHDIAAFYGMLFADYYSVNYDIKFNGKALSLLSPGQKGLVLMKLFLRLDKSSKPILIDQPEDNLDNKSVYTDLKDDIREVKKRRQIIIATHNPNLVVNTDAEQVIVAKFEDVLDNTTVRIQYLSGGLEDKEIRKYVCDILEGGEDAFRKREERYHS